MRKLSCPGRPNWPAAVVLAFAMCSWTLAAPATDFSKYHTYAELTATLQSLVKEHADIAKLVDIGKTKEGRSVWAVEIMNPKGSSSQTRSALLVAANFEGDHLVGSELALYTIDYLLNSYATNPEVKQQIDNHAFYIIPRMNPDGAELFFAPVKSERKTNAAAFDDDNDGRTDENGPEDLNKDGFITVMRVKDPAGTYIIHPDEPRLMRRADTQRGEVGNYKIYWEGLDKDNDGFIAEDGPGGADLNRNFMHKYPYYTPDAGRFMMSELESRALMDYVIGHKNIAAVLTYGESDNLIAAPNTRGELSAAQTIDLFNFAQQGLAESRRTGMYQAGGGGMRGFGMRGGGGAGGGRAGGRAGAAPAAGGRGGGAPARRPAETVSAADMEIFRNASEKYRQLTGLRSAPSTRTPEGAFFEVMYYQYGVPSFSTPGWGIASPSGGGGRGGGGAEAGMGGGGIRGGGAPGGAADGTAAFDLRMLRWMDSEKIDGFINWTPFKHPTLGDVEIGGFKPYATIDPPVARIADLGKPNAEFALYLASLFPNIAVASTEAANLGGGLFRIKAEIENKGTWPTSTAQGLTSRSVRPTLVQLEVDPQSIISGDAKSNNIQVLAGSGRRQSYQWIIKGKPGTNITLKVVAQKGGSDTATITLK